MTDKTNTEFVTFHSGEVMTRHFAASIAQIAATLSVSAQLQGQKIERAVALKEAMVWLFDSHELVLAHLKTLPKRPATADA